MVFKRRKRYRPHLNNRLAGTAVAIAKKRIETVSVFDWSFGVIRDFWFIVVVSISTLTGHVLAEELHRSPMAIAVSADHQVCITANQTSGTVSLVDLDSKSIRSELAVGRGPTDIAWIDPNTALVSLIHDDAIALIKHDGDKLRLVRSIPIGDEPTGLVISADRRRAFIALSGEDVVAVVDMDLLIKAGEFEKSVEIKRIAVGGIPKTLAISADGRWLVTCCCVPCEVFVHDAESLQQISARKIFDGGFNPGRPVITDDSQVVVLPSAVNRAFSVTAMMIDIGWVIDNRLTKLPLPDGEPGDQKQLGLDIRGKAVGDANSVAFSPDGKTIVVSCGGTHELLVLDYLSIPWPKGDPGDFLPDALRKDLTRFRRIKLGGRPVDVRFLDGHNVLVANYLDDCLQVVDIEANSIESTIPLGRPKELSTVRRGEAIFYDAERSHHSWFSCQTCHPDGHTSGQVFDTKNDRSYGTPKLTPSLRGVADTAPWTWHGWQTDLKDAMRRSLHESMSTEQTVTQDDVESLAAYLSTIDHPKNPRADSTSPALNSGRQLFEGKAGCIKCHAGSTFTSADKFDGAVEDPKDDNKQYNPPTLRGVSTRRRFLHTGKAKSLEQVLTKYHRPEDLVGESLSESEIAAIVEYLKTL